MKISPPSSKTLPNSRVIRDRICKYTLLFDAVLVRSHPTRSHKVQMAKVFDALEADFFGDLAEGTHGIWEVFEFVRLHHPRLTNVQVFERGQDYITRWIQEGWIRVSAAPLHPSSITTLPQLLEFLQQQGAAATRYLDDSPSIEPTQKALSVFNTTI